MLVYGIFEINLKVINQVNTPLKNTKNPRKSPGVIIFGFLLIVLNLYIIRLQKGIGVRYRSDQWFSSK